MRLLFLSSIFPHGTAPVKGTFNLELCRAFARRHVVRVVAPRPFTETWQQRGTCDEQLAADRWVAESFGLDVSYPTYFYTPKVLRFTYGSTMWHSVKRHLRKVITEFQPDAIASYWAHPDGEVALRAAREIGVPAICMIGGSDVLLMTNERLRRRRVQNVLSQLDAVTTVSESLRQRVIELGVPDDRVHTIYQGVDCDIFHSGDLVAARHKLSLPTDRPLLLWVGRMVDVKGLDVLVAALDRVRQQIPNVRLLLVGDGPLRESILNDVRQRGLTDHVHWVGPKGHSEIADWYRAANLTVLSSWSEGLPNVLRESLSCGRPFVSTNVGGVSEIANSQGGSPFAELVPIGDPVKLAQGIEQALAPSYLAAAQAWPRRSWDQCADDMIALLERLRGEPAQRGARFQRATAEHDSKVPVPSTLETCSTLCSTLVNHLQQKTF